MSRVFRSLALTGLLWAGITLGAAPRVADNHCFVPTFGDSSEEPANAGEAGKQGILLYFGFPPAPFAGRQVVRYAAPLKNKGEFLMLTNDVAQGLYKKDAFHPLRAGATRSGEALSLTS